MRALAPLAALVLAVPSLGHAACTPPAAALTYQVSWGGDPIGHYDLAFETDGERLRVRTAIDIEATMLFITVTALTHESVETWVDGRLRRFAGRTVDNGEETVVTLEPAGDGLAIVRNGNRRDTGAAILPGSLWCEALMRPGGPATFLDMVKGRIAEVEVRYLGQTEIGLGDRRVTTRHYAIEGGVRREVLYDLDGVGVQARLPAKFGPSNLPAPRIDA